MAEPILDAESVKKIVAKDADERLREELRICFPSVSEEKLQQFSRADLISKVTECRVFNKKTTKVQTSLEGHLTLEVVTEKVEPKIEVVSAPAGAVMDPTVMMLMKMMQDAEDRREKERKEEKAEQARLRKEEDDRREKLKKEEDDRKEQKKVEKMAAIQKAKTEEMAATQKAKTEEMAAIQKAKTEEMALQHKLEFEKLAEVQRLKLEEIAELAKIKVVEEADKEKARVSELERQRQEQKTMGMQHEQQLKLRESEEKLKIWEVENQARIAKEEKEKERLFKLKLEEMRSKDEDARLQKLVQEQQMNSEALKQVIQDQAISFERLQRQRLEAGEKIEQQIHRGVEILRNSIGYLPMQPHEIPLWFHEFQRGMTLNRLSEESGLAILTQLLNTKARCLLSRLPDSDVRSYEDLKGAILREFKVNASKLLEFYKSLHKRSEESYVMFSTRLKVSLVEYWKSRGIDLDDGNKKVLDLLISDKIKAELPRFLENFVRGHELEGWLDPSKLCMLLDGYDVDNNPIKQGANKFQNENFFRDQNRGSPNALHRDVNKSLRPDNRSRPVFASRRSFRCTICHRVNDHLADSCPSTHVKNPRDSRPQTNHESFRTWLDRRNNRQNNNRGRRGGPSTSRETLCTICGSQFHATDRCFRNPDRRDVNRVGLVFENSQQSSPENMSSSETLPKVIVNRIEMEVRCNSPDILQRSGEEEIPKEVKVKEREDDLSFAVSSISEREIRATGDLRVDLSCKGKPVPGLIDTGTQISVIHPGMLPRHLIQESNQRGTVKLKAAFGKAIISDVYLIPFKLIVDVSGRVCDQDLIETYLLCAVTDQLSENRVLLSLDDYNVLKSVEQVEVPCESRVCDNAMCSSFDPVDQLHDDSHSQVVDVVHDIDCVSSCSCSDIPTTENQNTHEEQICVVTRSNVEKENFEGREWIADTLVKIDFKDEKIN